MKREELNQRLDQLEIQFQENRNKEIRLYCISNNYYKIGDKFTDHIGTILIERINYSLTKFCCIYYGIELKKDGTPRKDNSKREAWQSNEIKL